MLGLEKVPCIIADDLTPEQIKAFRLADNKVGELAEWDFAKLEEELVSLADMFDMNAFGFDETMFAELPDVGEGIDERHESLQERFIVPPFSVFDGRAGYWMERKREWKRQIQDAGQARSNVIVYDIKGDYAKDFAFDTGTSILDPVLAEIVNLYFVPNTVERAKTFDVFAGDTVFGFVSSKLGNEFTGIELRQEQRDFNQMRVDEYNLPAQYICDDGRNVLNHLPEDSQDLLFSCPPYFDLEQYSNLPNDASNQGTFEEFYEILDVAFTNAVKALKENRFAVIVVGGVRNKSTGHYYDFTGAVKNTFARAGMGLYNDAVLITPVGSAAIRANRCMKTRKLCNVYQNVLVFYKGDTGKIREGFHEIETREGLFDAGKNE